MRLTIILLIVIASAGVAGAFIGYALVDLQCTGSCGAPRVIGGLTGVIATAIGVGVVGNLIIRAVKESPKSR